MADRLDRLWPRPDLSSAWLPAIPGPLYLSRSTFAVRSPQAALRMASFSVLGPKVTMLGTKRWQKSYKNIALFSKKQGNLIWTGKYHYYS